MSSYRAVVPSCSNIPFFSAGCRQVHFQQEGKVEFDMQDVGPEAHFYKQLKEFHQVHKPEQIWFLFLFADSASFRVYFFLLCKFLHTYSFLFFCTLPLFCCYFSSSAWSMSHLSHLMLDQSLIHFLLPLSFGTYFCIHKLQRSRKISHFYVAPLIPFIKSLQ